MQRDKQVVTAISDFFEILIVALVFSISKNSVLVAVFGASEKLAG
jgi:hypothetical protein